MLPVIVGLLLISIIFQTLNSKFLTAGNLVNLLVQGAVFILLAMAEVFALVLGEIDLSAGFVGGIAGIVVAELLTSQHGSWPWWARLRRGPGPGRPDRRGAGHDHHAPEAAVVRGHPGRTADLAGRDAADPGQRRHPARSTTTVINDLANGILTPLAGWVVMIVMVVLFGLMTWTRDARRRRSGLVAPPVSLTVIKIVAAAVAGSVVVLICNVNRGILEPIQGVPWVVLIVLGVLAMWTVLLGRTKFGRYVYAIGGNAEATRRAGVNLATIRTVSFMLCSFTAGIAGIIYASRLRSVSTNLDGGTLVLYSVAAAVIGGASLFGGRGKPIHAVLGGLVIAAIDNGMGLQGFSAAAKYVVTGIVLLAAVTIDALARRGRTAGT